MSFCPSVRLLVDEPAAGDWNMAVDEVLLWAAQQGQATLRFYRWSPATLSLGYFQPLADRERHAPSRDCAVVRRATGGGAILHDQELTYSISLPCQKRFSPNAEGTYDAFHDTLVELLVAWGIAAHRCEQSDPDREDNFLCFHRRARGDVLVGDRKIAGSAQRRQRGGLLQHGSVLLAASAYAPDVPGLKELSSTVPNAVQLVNEWILLLKNKLGSSIEEGKLTPAELSQAKQVASDRFRGTEWIARF